MDLAIATVVVLSTMYRLSDLGLVVFNRSSNDHVEVQHSALCGWKRFSASKEAWRCCAALWPDCQSGSEQQSSLGFAFLSCYGYVLVLGIEVITKECFM